MEALNILRPISQSHKDVVSLQAADMLAHQLARKRIAILRGQPDNRGGYVDRLCNIGAHVPSGERRAVHGILGRDGARKA